ncbi:MAG: hypothetical protein AB7R90_05170 [Reyranellaceae bacterium]
MRTRTLLATGMLALFAATAQAQEPRRCPAQLPAPVAAKRDAIVAAAKARDWATLQKLTGPGEFAFSFGDDTDAIAYWRQAAAAGTDVLRMMQAVFAMGCVTVTNTRGYFFPPAAEIEWKRLNAAERKAMEALYGKAIDEWYVEGRAKGYYVGWRGVIEPDGAWSAFVAGD